LAEWQKNELAGLPQIAYVVAMTEDGNKKYPEPNDAIAWKNELGFASDALLLDPDVTPEGMKIPAAVMSQYVAANPGPKYTEAITVILDKEMRIRKVGGTYEDTTNDSNLELLLQLANE
jgi:hypothetical protein